MARVTYVKKAQQRYKTVPVIDPETGEQKKTPVMRTRRLPDGGTEKVQKTTKTGRPVFMKVTTEDKSQPLPNRKCEKCGKEIEVGSSYKHVTPKSGPYGGRKRVRCSDCPTWQQWDLSNSLSAQVARIQFENEVSDPESSDELTQAAEAAASEIRDLAEEKKESAQNIVDGFGHETSTSEELAQVAEDLESWADELEQFSPSEDAPDRDDFEEGDEGDEEYDEAMEAWRELVVSEYDDVLNNSPV